MRGFSTSAAPHPHRHVLFELHKRNPHSPWRKKPSLYQIYVVAQSVHLSTSLLAEGWAIFHEPGRFRNFSGLSGNIPFIELASNSKMWPMWTEEIKIENGELNVDYLV